MSRRLLCAIALVGALPVCAAAQQYRNVVNLPFRSVASGPLSVHVVDLPASSRAEAARDAVATAVRSLRARRDAGVLAYLQAMRRLARLPAQSTPGIPEVVAFRQSGRLMLPPLPRTTRAANELTFVFPAQGSPGSWSPAWENDLRAIISIVYPELKSVYGSPAWSGTVTILNGDNMSPIISDPNALSGGIYNVSTSEITFQQNNSAQSAVLNLTQMLALAFRGPALVSYDAWEKGMARAATLLAVRNSLPQLQATPSQVFGGTLGDISVADPLWHALDRYEWLNQPALANDRFFPVSKQDATANQPGWPNMLVPRLQMSGSTWLKVLTEAPSFLSNFNSLYYAALQTNPNIRNSVPELANIAAQALAAAGGSTVEGLPFMDWYRRQFILDTSISLGPKLYAQVSALRPDPADDDFGIGVILTYYRTSLDAQGNSDEVDLAATAYPIYRDYTFDNRLFLGAQYEQVDIRNGIGTVAPTFYNTIGGDATLQGRMRITMDFPVGSESLRIETAPRSSGKIGSDNNFWGVVVGADTGTIRLDAEGYSTGEIQVRQGAFGAAVDPTIFSRPRRGTLTFTASDSTVTTRSVITGYGEYVVVFEVQGGVDERVYTLPGGPSMVAFPVRPLQQRAADALLDPTTGAPLFNDTNLLMARWIQTLSGDDKYARYPNLEPLMPGKGYWLSLPQATAVKIRGRLASRDRDVTVGLVYGWNQIGNPYETVIPASSLQFQYKADNVPVDLATAVARGWVVAHSIPGVGQSAVWAYSPASGYMPVQNLDPWTGYWIRVLVSEGLTLTYPSPQSKAVRSAATRAAASAAGWAVRLMVTDPRGRGAVAVIGQSPDSSATGRAELPPIFAADAPALWMEPVAGTAEGRYYSDIRSSGDRRAWSVTVSTPLPNTDYTLRWSLPPTLPRTTRLVLLDSATGRRRYMHADTSLVFNSGESPTRRFLVIPEMRGADVCRILNPRVTPSRAPGAVSVSFDVTTAAAVAVAVRSTSGLVIRNLERGRAASAGAVTLLWDGRDDRGIAVPAGVYSMVITARTDTGDAARIMVPVVVTR